jgi:N-acyl-L-homoserine lactone synthetase
MIHVVTLANRAMYQAQLVEMHAQRKAFFVDELNWKACEVRDGGEYDDMDDDRAVYLLSLDETGHVQAGLRMRPTDDKSIILDRFPETVDPEKDPGKGPLVWEGSRIYQVPAVRGARGQRVRGELRIAAIEFGLTRGFTGLLGMCDVAWLATLRNNGWRSTILGPPAACDEGEAFSFVAEVSP